MLPCVRFVTALFAIISASGLFFIITSNLSKSGCGKYYGRVCNDQGTCAPDGVCLCNALFSGDRCENTGVMGYIALTNQMCGGHGTVMQHDAYTFPECAETAPSRFYPRSGGWNTTQCRNRLKETRKKVYYYETANAVDVLGLPMCLCRPGFAGPGCEDACPRSLDDEICSGFGNKTVDFMFNGTVDGLGCQCDSILSLAKIVPFLNRVQIQDVADNYEWYKDGLCAELVRVDIPLAAHSARGRNRTTYVVVPSSTNAYKCHCDERHDGDRCQDGWCDQTEEGRLCSGHGHKGLGFGYEYNTTRSVSAFGEPGVPMCAVGKNGCCLENQGLCGIPELECPSDRPYRCSSTAQCVGLPRTSRCDQAWEYGYWDDPSKAPRRTLKGGDNGLNSRLAAFFFRVKNGTLSFTYRGQTHTHPGGGEEFWSGVLNETVEAVVERAFEYEQDVEIQKDRTVVEFWPAHFVHGEVFEPMIRLKSSYGQHAVVDVVGSRVEFGLEGMILANLSADAMLKPGGGVVDLAACLDDLSSCAWSGLQDGEFSLCERNGKLGSVRAQNACEFPSRAFLKAYTVAYGKPRVVLEQWAGDARWELQTLVQSPTSVLTVEATGIWAGQFVTLDDLRAPCVCEPAVLPNVNASAYNAKWSAELTRPKASEGGLTLAKVETFGDGRWTRGVLQRGGLSVIDEYGDSHVGVTASKVLTKAEYVKGRPTPVDAVHPHRCPDGRGAKSVMHVLKNVPASTNCTMLSLDSTKCDNGCACNLRRCTCPESESEAPLFDLVSQKRGKCWIVRPENGNWTLVSYEAPVTRFESSAFDVPLVFRGTNITAIQARFAGGAWFDVDYEHAEESAYPSISDVTKPFDEWIVTAESQVEAEFLPTGISAYRAYPDFYLRASENSDDAENVVWNDLTTWNSTDRGFFRVDFPRPVRLIGLYVVFETMGLWVDEDFGALNTTISVHASGSASSRDEFRMDWEWIADVVGNAFESSDARFIPFVGAYESLRIVSRFPMSIRRFIPLTDQICDLGLLIPDKTYPEDVVRSERRTNPNSTVCVSDDSCELDGQSAAGDGVCSDYKYLTWGLEPVESFSVALNLTAAQVVALSQPLLRGAEILTACWNDCCAWGPVVPEGAFACNETLVFDGVNTTIARTAYPPNFVTLARTLTWGSGLVEGVNTCANGTDYTDCGDSERYDRANPGQSCTPTELELEFMTRNTSEHEFQTSAHVGELLSMGMRLNFTVEWVRNKTKLGRGPCGDCDGRVRCVDGTCVDYSGQCPQGRYITPGDGCVKIDINRKSYKCACEVGWSGFACDKGPCKPMDPNTGAGDPHDWCTCGGPYMKKSPKVKVKPPFLFKVKNEGYSRKDLLRMNRARKRVSEGDVGMENVRFTEAPWGVAIKRQFTVSGVTKYSNCPLVVQIPDGRYMTLEECVEERATEYPHVVTKWRSWPFINGTAGNVTYKWDGPWYEVKYDAAPWRCGSTCVADERECYRNELVNPPCGGNGECRADSSCRCKSGWETFVLTDRLSSAVSVPYASTNGVSEPTEWTRPDPLWYDTASCRVRNCSAVDCDPPYGCFVGTLTLSFADKMVACDSASGHKGMCALDAAACKRGDVSAPILCSGNGILRKRDYRDEWYCECGSPRSLLIKDARDVRETSELVPNGFGGPRCDQYYSQDDQSKIWLQRTDPRTNLPFVGSDGLPLPFKWRGPSDAPVGPKVEELGLWRQCCSEKRLDKCQKIPCLKGRADKKYMVCEHAHLCLDATSQPLVYSCNGHGKALADGTCECESSETEGFTHDESLWSGKGCIKRSQCEIAKSSRTMCNRKSDCGDFEAWSEMPYLPYFNQQWPMLAIKMGLPPTNQTLVDLVFKDDRKPRIKYVASQIGQLVDDANASASTAICRYPNDDPNNPFGMVAFDPATTCEYGEGYDSPFMLTELSFVGASAVLTNGVFGGGAIHGESVRLTRTAASLDDDAGVGFTVTFPKPTTIRAIRINARKVAGSADPKLEFLNADGFKACNSPGAVTSTTSRWLESQNVVYCVPFYTAFRFNSIDNLLQFRTNCEPSEGTTKCTQWKDALCASLGYVVNPPGGYLKMLPGCNGARCCIPDAVNTYDPTTSLTVRLVNSVLTQTLDVAEIQVYGTHDAVDEVPANLKREIDAKIYPLESECRDGKFMNFLFDQGLTAHLARNWTDWPLGIKQIPDASDQMSYDSAHEMCDSMGGHLATNRGGEISVTYADVPGRACFQDASNVSCLVNARDRNEVFSPQENDVVFGQCTTWGCWTPYLPLNAIDYFSTARNDSNGRQWMTEWVNDTFMRLDDAVYELVEEGLRQKALVVVPGDEGDVIRQHQTIRWTHVFRSFFDFYSGTASYGLWTKTAAGDGFSLWNSIVPSEGFTWNGAALFTYSSIWRILYTPQYVSGPPYVKSLKPDVLAQQRAQGATSTVSVWTNANKTCVLTIYSRALCGREKFHLGSSGTSVLDRGAKRTFVVTPADDYSVLSTINVLLSNKDVSQTYNRCVEGSCDDLNKPISDNFGSFSLRGPCALEIVTKVNPGNDPNNGYYYATHYVTRPQSRPTPLHHLKFVEGSIVDGAGVWYDGCYPQYARQPPYDACRSEYLLLAKDGVSPMCLTGLNTDQVGETMFYNESVPGEILKNVIRANSVLPVGNTVFNTESRTGNGRMRHLDPGNKVLGTTLKSIRVMAKFTSRKLEINFRANPTASTPNENDFVLGYEQHPYMCTNVQIRETKRVFAGVRFPEARDVVHTLNSPVRIKLGAQILMDAYTTTTEGEIKRSAYTPTIIRTVIPSESDDGVKEFTEYELRKGMLQLQEKMFALGLDGAAVTYGPYCQNAQGNFYTCMGRTFNFNEPGLNVTSISDGELLAGSAFESSTLVMPYAKCDGIDLPREVRRCSACLVPKTSVWEWNQQFFNPENVQFQARLTSTLPTSNLYVTWNSTRTPALQKFQPLAPYESTNPAAYARLISTFVPADYRRELTKVNHTTPAHYFDACVVVSRTTLGTYFFRTVVCQNPSYRAVCVRDYKRYTVQSGCQCPPCGPDSRSVLLLVNSTVYDLYPLANRELFPIDHAIRDAWRAGTLDSYLNINPLPADAVVAYLWSTNQSFIEAIPGFFRAFWGLESTRDNFLSRGQVADSQTWTDFNFPRMFPHSCKTVYSRFTGEGKPMCAKSAEFCSLDQQFETPLMNLADYPKALESLPENEDPRRTAQCGRFVVPWKLLSPTEDEPPPPADGGVLLLEHTEDDYVTIKTLVQEAYVRNTYRDLDVIKPGSVMVGEITCSDSCSVIVWIGSTNPFFLASETRYDVGTAQAAAGTTVEFAFTVPTDADLSYRTMGWDIGAPVGTIVKLGRVLITDDDSVAACRRSKVGRPLVEPPPNVVSPAPQHQCVNTDRLAQILKVRYVGKCWCSDASPYGGPACEWPATIGKHGKRICNMFEGVRKTASMEIAPNGQIVVVDTNGVYQYFTGDRIEFGCKMRADVGSILKVRLVPAAMSDFVYVVKNMAKPNEDEFTLKEEDEITDLQFNFPVKAAHIADVCNAFSGSLPSFSTADELANYLAEGVTEVFLDIGDALTTWQQRGEPLRINASRTISEPCVTDPAVCRALNFNNLVFDAAGSFLVDGKSALGTLAEFDPQTLVLRTPTDRVTVQLVGCTDSSAVTVSAYNGTTYACTEFVDEVSECEIPTNILSIIVESSADVQLREIGAFWAEDGARMFLFDQ